MATAANTRPTHNRCDFCGRRPHKVCVTEPARRRPFGGEVVPAATHGYCPKCVAGYKNAFPAGTVVRYDRRTDAARAAHPVTVADA